MTTNEDLKKKNFVPRGNQGNMLTDEEQTEFV